MNELMQSGQPTATTPEMAPAMDQGGAAQTPGDAVSPEEQEQYNQFVAQSYNLIYDEKTLPGIVQMLRGEGDPIEGLARTASMVVARVASSAEASGVSISPEVGLHAGTEVFEDLADLSKKVGIHDFEADPDGLEGAYFRALDELRTTMQDAGKLHPEAAQRDLATLQQMDQSGDLKKMLVGLAERDASSRAQAAPAEPQQPAQPMGGGLMQGAM